jgi:hypothetical protein
LDRKKISLLHKRICIISSEKNIGFSKAINIAFRNTKSKYVLILNPDTIIIDDNFDLLLENFKDKHTAVVGCKLVNKEDNTYLSANSEPNFFTAIFEFTNLKKIFKNNLFTKKFWIEKTYSDNYPIKVHSVCGAFLLIDKTRIHSDHIFNESYFLYLEDLDLGYYIKSINQSIVFDPRYKIKHIGGQSNTSKYGAVLKHWYKSRNIFFNKHLNKPFSLIASLLFIIEESLLSLYHYFKNEPKE